MKRKPPPEINIKVARIRAGLTQKQAAELVAVNVQTFAAWEQGKTEMHPNHFECFQLRIKELREAS